MASDGVPVNPPVTRLVQGSQASISGTVQTRTGNPLPSDGNAVPAKAAGHPPVDPATKTRDAALSVKSDADLKALIAHLNKHFNDSGQPIQFRVDPNSGNKLIQEINPATGDVVGDYSAAEFPALARGLGVSGLMVDKHA